MQRKERKMKTMEIEPYYVLHRLPEMELICAPFGSYKRKGHDWNGKSQKKIRRERRQKGNRR